MAIGGGKKRVILPLGIFAVLAVGFVAIVRQLAEDSELASAKQAFALRHFPEAERLLQNYLAAHPDDLEARLLAAQTARLQRKYEEASRHLRLFEQRKGSPVSLRMEYRAIALMRGDLGEADVIFQECLEKPHSPETHILLEALIVGPLDLLTPHLTLHSPLPIDRAKPLIDKNALVIGFWLETQTSPADQAAGWIWRARLRELSSDHEGALADLRRVLESDSNNYDAGYYYALFISPHAPLEALQRLEAMSQRSADAQLLFGIASCSRSLGDLKKSREILNQLIARNTNDSSAYLELGLVALDEEKPQEAESLLRKALLIAPQQADVHLALARCMLMLGKHEEARRFQDRFLELEAKRGSVGMP